MRLAMVAQWLRAAAADPDRRTTARRYAIGISVLQVAWVLTLAVPHLWVPAFLFLATVELLVPVWAESAQQTTWHPHHISERYGLLTLIVLGESILAASVAIQSALASGGTVPALVPVIVGGLLIVYSMWWVYFDRPVHDLLTSFRKAMMWGYGHYLVFASAAAVGAGLGVAVDQAARHAEISSVAAGFAVVAVPVTVFIASLWAPARSAGTPRIAPGGAPLLFSDSAVAVDRAGCAADGRDLRRFRRRQTGSSTTGGTYPGGRRRTARLSPRTEIRAADGSSRPHADPGRAADAAALRPLPHLRRRQHRRDDAAGGRESCRGRSPSARRCSSSASVRSAVPRSSPLLAPIGTRLRVPSIVAARAALGINGAQALALLLFVTNFAWIALNNVIAASICVKLTGASAARASGRRASDSSRR